MPEPIDEGTERLIARKLDDRIETYEMETEGFCRNCGRKVVMVIGSNCTNRADKVRYRTFEDNHSAWCLFRCDKCHEVIEDTFVAALTEGREGK